MSGIEPTANQQNLASAANSLQHYFTLSAIRLWTVFDGRSDPLRVAFAKEENAEVAAETIPLDRREADLARTGLDQGDAQPGVEGSIDPVALGVGLFQLPPRARPSPVSQAPSGSSA